MHTVTTIEDVRRIASILPETYARRIEADFVMLHSALSAGESIETFSLENHGYFVILEAGDNVWDLSAVGLHPEDQGLLGSMPEYVEILSLGDDVCQDSCRFSAPLLSCN